MINPGPAFSTLETPSKENLEMISSAIKEGALCKDEANFIATLVAKSPCSLTFECSITIESLEISTPKEETISLNFCFINSSNSIYISPNRSVELTAHHLRYRKISLFFLVIHFQFLLF